MRASSATLSATPVRLWDLVFPRSEARLVRTRAAYVHLDNLISFSKRDRDGREDAYLAIYLPDELALLFFLGGELVNAALLTPVGRFPASISEAMRHARAEPERGEMAFHTAPAEQLAAMYATCAQAPLDLGLDASTPESVFKALYERRWTGLLELIANGRVNYLRVREGRFAAGHFADRLPDEAPLACVTRLLAPSEAEPRPVLSARAYPGLEALPMQAPPAMVAMFRRFVWDLAESAERELPGDGIQRAERVRMRLVGTHDVLRSVGGPRGAESADPIAEPPALADGLAAWTREFLGELDVVRPEIAVRLLAEAAREHRFALNAVGFFERLPWRVQW